MSVKKKPKVIILEHDEMVSKHAETILTKEGWDVTCEKTSEEALEYLASSKKILFALFISNFKLPKMQGDDILSKVKSLSPLTQRMLITPGDNSETLIKAINKADIHACSISPLKEEALINQARNCLKQFKHALKRAQLKRVTNHQNKQMFNIARKLKKKTKAYEHLINERNAQKIKLKSKKRELEKLALLSTDISLENLLGHKKVPQTPEIFQKEFFTICESIKLLFDQLTTQYSVKPVQLNFDTIFKTDQTKEHPSDTDTAETEPDSRELPEEKPEKKPEEQSDKPQPVKDSEQTPEKTSNSEQKALEHNSLVDQVLKAALTGIAETPAIASDTPEKSEDTEDINPEEHILDKYFQVTISNSQTEAFIKRIKPTDTSDPEVSVSNVLDLLLQKEISYGLLDDAEIELWLSKPEEDKISIAKGEEPVQGQDGSIQFHFQTDFTNPGKISEDGTIDFRDRGDIPFTAEGTLLAQKTLAKQGSPGISISGTPIPVKEVLDPVFTAGTGARISEDETCIYATLNGQPHLDKLGTISVSPELIIPNDVDYETGNIDFKGNITVKGMIKEGFTVKGVNLTVKEIEGGTIDISGDLNVSGGITESTILVQGNTQAKFINHSNIMGFGDLTVSKEIIDSKIILSGKCINSTGHIISSQITAKLGVEAGDIGTPSSIPVKLKVGVEEHIELLDKQIDDNLKTSVNKTKALRDEIKKLEEQDRTLYEQISEKAQIQDRSQVEITQISKSMPDIEKSNNLTQLQQLSNKIKKLQQTAQDAEKELNRIFKTQDQIANNIESHKKQIKQVEEKNKKLVLEKKALKEFSIANPPDPSVLVAKTITQDTLIKGAHSSKFLKEDQKRCKLIELAEEENGIIIYEIKTTDL